MRKQVLVAMTVVTLGAGAVAEAAEGGHRPRRGLREELGLTDQQAADLARLRSDARKAAIRRRADIGVAKEELRDLLMAPELDARAVSVKVDQLSALHAAGVKAHADKLVAMRRLLTSEQMETLSRLPEPRRGATRAGPARTR